MIFYQKCSKIVYRKFIFLTTFFGVSYGAGLVAAFIPGGSLIVSMIVTPAFSLSLIRVYLNVIKGGATEAKDAFCGFDDFWSAFKVTFFTGLFTFLWSLLFLIPGIIKAYEYSMSMYILAENKGKPALECLKESKEMTNGRKMDLFVLNLSFVGWLFLVVFTLGIAYIWVGPYMQATMANAYQSFKPVAEPAVQYNTETVEAE